MKNLALFVIIGYSLSASAASATYNNTRNNLNSPSTTRGVGYNSQNNPNGNNVGKVNQRSANPAATNSPNTTYTGSGSTSNYNGAGNSTGTYTGGSNPTGVGGTQNGAGANGGVGASTGGAAPGGAGR